MKTTNFLTDMALEAVENVKNGLVPYTVKRGANGIIRTVVKVDTVEKSRLLGKRQGIYVTFETEKSVAESGVAAALRAEIAASIVDLVATMKKGAKKVMAVGLGNGQVEADALGVRTIAKLNVTRPYFLSGHKKSKVGTNLCAITPGVYAATGIESADMVSAVINEVRPDIIIAVDALAAAKTKRLYKSFQLTTAGIVPGSGVGATTGEMTKQSLKIPVLAVGVPLALYASSMIKEGALKAAERAHIDISASGASIIAEEVLGEDNAGLIVTPKNIKSLVENASDVIAQAINRAFRN